MASWPLSPVMWRGVGPLNPTRSASLVVIPTGGGTADAPMRHLRWLRPSGSTKPTRLCARQIDGRRRPRCCRAREQRTPGPGPTLRGQVVARRIGPCRYHLHHRRRAQQRCCGQRTADRDRPVDNQVGHALEGGSIRWLSWRQSAGSRSRRFNGRRRHRAAGAALRGRAWTNCTGCPGCDNTAMAKDISTKLSHGGLRYATKPPGSPFLGTGNTRSCFKCGKHRQQGQLQSKRVLGRSEMVCAPACNAVE
jgi:hypothetical protein